MERALSMTIAVSRRSWGTLGALLLLPALVYYLWIAVEFYGGALPSPRSVLIGHVLDRAWPTWKALGIYAAWVAWQVLLAMLGPGPRGQGALLPDGKSRLPYHSTGCSPGTRRWRSWRCSTGPGSSRSPSCAPASGPC